MPIEDEQKIFIVTVTKKPSHACGLYIREDTIPNSDIAKTGIFISRIIKEDNKGTSPLSILQPGDEILTVNEVNLSECQSIDSVVTMMSTSSSLTMKMARHPKIIKKQEIPSVDVDRENPTSDADWLEIEQKKYQLYHNEKQSYIELERSIQSNVHVDAPINCPLNNNEDESIQRNCSNHVLMKRYPLDSHLDDLTVFNRNLDIRRLQLEQPSADDSNDSGLSSENSHTSRDVYYPRFSELACHPYIQGVYQKHNMHQIQQSSTSSNVPNVLRESESSFFPESLIHEYYRSQTSQNFMKKPPCSSALFPTSTNEDKSTQFYGFDRVPLTAKPFPLDYNSDSEITVQDVSSDYTLPGEEKGSSMNRTSSMRNTSTRGNVNENRCHDFPPPIHVAQGVPTIYQSNVSRAHNYNKKHNEKAHLRTQDIASAFIVSRGTSTIDQTGNTVLYSVSSMPDNSESSLSKVTNLHSGSLLSNRYIPSEGNDYRILQSERWMKPIGSTEQTTGVSGILVVNVIAGCTLQSNHSLLRDLYCVLEIDSVRKARSMIRTSTEVFEWDEIFEIDLWNSHFLSILLYQWDPKTHHRLCFYGGINIVKFSQIFQSSDVSIDKIILQLEPKGLLYLEVAFLTWELSFIRQLNNRDNSVFGRPGNELTSAVSFTSGFDTRPFVLTLCIEEIERRGLDTIGLYRLCGAAKLKAQLRQLFESNLEFADLSSNAIPDIHVITSVLKDFLRELPEPLFTTSIYKICVQSTFYSATYDTQEGTIILINIFLSLPPINRNSLIYLIDHLIRVAQRNDINKMTFLELSCIFASLLLQPSYEQIPNYHGGIQLEKLEIDFFHFILKKWTNIRSIILSHTYPQGLRRPPSMINIEDCSSNSSIAVQTKHVEPGRPVNVPTPKKSLKVNSQPTQNKSILRNSNSRVRISDRRSVHDLPCEDLL